MSKPKTDKSTMKLSKRPKAGAAKPLRIKTLPQPTIERQVKFYTRRLNDLHVGTQVTLAALAMQKELVEHNAGATRYFSVPSGGTRETARIERNAKQMAAMLERMIAFDERSQSLLVAVSITEDFILNILKLILRAYPERMNRGIKGGEAETRVPLDELLDRTRDEILEDLIQNRLYRTLHDSPSNYLEYLKNILEIGISDALVERFVEIKATRDLVVHANGRVNATYVKKAGPHARAGPQATIPIGEAYFDRSIATMKSLMLEVGNGVKAKYAGDEKIQAHMDRFQS